MPVLDCACIRLQGIVYCHCVISTLILLMISAVVVAERLPSSV